MQIFVNTGSYDVLTGLSKGSIPLGQRRVKSQIYDNVIIHPVAKLKKRLSTPGIASNFDPTTFDPVPERDELLQRSSGSTDLETDKPSEFSSHSSMNLKDTSDNNVRSSTEVSEGLKTDQNGETVVQTTQNFSIAQTPSSSNNNSNKCESTSQGEQGSDTVDLTEEKSSDMASTGQCVTQRRESFRLLSGRVQESEDAMTASVDDSDEWAQVSHVV